MQKKAIKFKRPFSLWAHHPERGKRHMKFNAGEYLPCFIEEIPPGDPNFKTHKLTTGMGYQTYLSKSQLAFVEILDKHPN